MEDIERKLEQILNNNNNNILKNEPMSKHTSFKIGGMAEYFLKIQDEDELLNVLKLCNQENINFQIVGNGSNILVTEKGIKGFVIKLEMKKYSIEENNEYCFIRVDSGMSLAEIAMIAYKNGYSGLEFASGIPGTIGGAIRMNAGAFGSEMKDIVISTKCIDSFGNKYELSNEEQNFKYRSSTFENNGLIILQTVLKLKKASQDEIKNKMDEYAFKRKESQPLDYPSAGSIFKRNENMPTAKMIDECGLKGYRIGGAEISEKHAGFIINKENATSQDVLDLIDIAKKEVKKKFDQDIELEVLIIE